MVNISNLSKFKSVRVTAIAFLFFAIVYAASANSESGSVAFSIDHLLKLQTPSDVQIDPSGHWVAYVVQRNDEEKDKRFKKIWMTSVDGKTTLPMTADYATASKPRWNPDGSTLAFMGKRGDGKNTEKIKTQVWLLSRQGGEAQQFTDVEQGVSGFAWAPDGKSMLLSIQDPEPKDDEAEKTEESKQDRPKPWVIDRLQFKKDYVGYLDRRRTHIYLFDGKSAPVQITNGDYDHTDPQWSPDGSIIAFVSKRQDDPDFNNNGDIWTVQADPKAKEHALTQVTTNPGNDHSPAWSPDSKSITYVTETEPEKLWYATDHLAVVNADGSKARILTKQYDRMVHHLKFSANGRNIYFMAEDGGKQAPDADYTKIGQVKNTDSR